MEQNKAYQTLLILFIITGVLVVLSFVNTSFTIGDITFKDINILSTLIKEPETDTKAISELKNSNKEEKEGLSKEDSIRLKELADTVINHYGADSVHMLHRFFSALKQTKRQGGKTRIAYFGDSMIEGDLITQTVRKIFQREFGGSGVGFVPITSQVANFRRTIKHSFSDNWVVNSILNTEEGKKYGISGYVFQPAYPEEDEEISDSSTVPDPTEIVEETIESYVQYQGYFPVIKLYFGPSREAASLRYNAGGTEFNKFLSGNSVVNESLLYAGAPVQKVELFFQADTAVDIYGLSMESESGVFLDNFAVRGNSGLALTAIPYSVLSGFNRYFHYDLIVLQYGVNVAADDMEDFSWYESGMKRVVRHLQKAIPTADILIISVGDKSYKKEMDFITPPSIPLLVKAQRNVARKTGVAFWNLYQAMGGQNSMVEWVNAEKPLANKDYTHFSARGAGKIGTMLSNHLLREFHKYEKKAE